MDYPKSGYRFLDHITDAEIEAYGATLDECFENAAKALEDTMVDIGTIEPQHEAIIEVEGRDKEELLYQWLEALIARQDTEGMLFSKISCKIFKKKNGFALESTVSGEKFDPKKHDQKTAIKAPTLHEMLIEQSPEKAKIHFILDL